MMSAGTPHSGNLTIINATAVLADRILNHATIRIEAGVIVAVEQGNWAGNGRSPVLDARHAYVIPGIVDLHNDNLELEIHPRANASLPLPFALSTMERRLAASGVTTEFHAISFKDDLTKGRSISDAQSKAAYIAGFEDDPRHGVRHNILHRLDVRVTDSIDQALPTIRSARTPFASLNDHTPGQGQYRDVERLIRMAHQQAATRNEHRTDPDWYRRRMLEAQADLETVPAFYRRVAEVMSITTMVLSSHDDDTPAKVDEQLQLGASIAEFPVTFEAAEHARAHGMTIVVGAPNVVRGGSQSGNLNAADLVRRGLADIICADYHAPSMLPAAFRLVQDGLLSLPEAIGMLSRNPANAVGMVDRGELRPGMIGDLAIVRLDDAGWPHVESTIVDGCCAFQFLRSPEPRKPWPTRQRPGEHPART